MINCFKLLLTKEISTLKKFDPGNYELFCSNSIDYRQFFNVRKLVYRYTDRFFRSVLVRLIGAD